MRLKEPLSLVNNIFSEPSSTFKVTGDSLGNLDTISERILAGIVIAPDLRTFASKEFCIPKFYLAKYICKVWGIKNGTH